MTFRAPVLVKLGGSLITDKSGTAGVRQGELERLAEEIAAFRSRSSGKALLILGHGSGSFGHRAAAAHGVGRGPVDGPRKREGAARTAAEAARLHRRVVGTLLEAGVPAWSCPPSSALTARRGRPVAGTIDPLLRALDGGWVPVVYGDVLMDRDWGASVCSTEVIFLYLARRLARQGRRPDGAIWLGATDGILDGEGRTVQEVGPERVDEVRRLVGGSEGTDVTGGMVLRYETTLALAALGIESLVADGRRPGLLEAALAGEADTGTRIRAHST